MVGRANLGRGLVASWCLIIAAGCAELAHESSDGEITAAGPAAEATAPPPAEDGTSPESAAPSTQAAARAGSTENSNDVPSLATRPYPAPPSASAAEVAPGVPRPPPDASEAPAAQEAGPGRAPNSSEVASPKSAETLDFTSLVSRLRETKAIGLLTKIAVKNESDALLAKFRAYHTQHGTATLGDLRRSYDLLFGKLHSLLQDTDPPLAHDVDRSRAAIWEILADPRKFRASGA